MSDNMYEAQVAAMTQTIPATELNDAEEMSEDRRIKLLEKQANRFNKRVEQKIELRVPAHKLEFRDKKGEHNVLNIDDSDAILYLLEDQPNAPQITANATQSRSGPARMSDEA